MESGIPGGNDANFSVRNSHRKSTLGYQPLHGLLRTVRCRKSEYLMHLGEVDMDGLWRGRTTGRLSARATLSLSI